jgi:hypothetical protein
LSITLREYCGLAKGDMTAATNPRPRFDVREFTKTARGNHRAELDLSDLQSSPLTQDSLRAISYLRDLESATMQWLRNVLVTATHKDARVTAFLVTWAFEKFWIADALQAVVEASGYQSPPRPEGPRRRSMAERAERIGPIRRALQAIVVGPTIVAVHTTTELVDQWVTRAAYERIAEVSDNRALRSTVELILDVKARHEEFFFDESVRRLSESERAARLTRRSLRAMAWPIGAADHSDEDRTFFERYVFGNAAGSSAGAAAADAIATRIAELPRIGSRVAQTVRGRLVS